jgi:hypothetical protein
MVGFLSLLGLLAMHSTPTMPAMAHSGSFQIHGLRAAPSGDAMLDAMPPQPAALVMVEGARHGRHLPPAHMAAPCVSDAARTPHHAITSQAVAASPTDTVARQGVATVRTANDLDRAPPDLTQLCISRT